MIVLSLIRFVAIAAMLCALPGTVNAASLIKRTHLLTIAACPPRPGIGDSSRDACAHLLPILTATLAQRLAVESSDIHQLLNDQATGPRLLAQLKDYADRLGPDDRLVITMISHGGTGPDRTRSDEIFMLWTEQPPAFFQLGLATGVYVPAVEFAAAVHKLRAGEVVVILDACESGLADAVFVSQHPDKRPERPEAVVTSTTGTQLAMMDVDYSPAFSTRLLAALQRAHPTLADVLMDAAADMRRDAPGICHGWSAPKRHPLSCEQDPTLDDPAGLLSRIALRPAQRLGID